jgi:hypothetical protein
VSEIKIIGQHARKCDDIYPHKHIKGPKATRFQASSASGSLETFRL